MRSNCRSPCGTNYTSYYMYSVDSSLTVAISVNASSNLGGTNRHEGTIFWLGVVVIIIFRGGPLNPAAKGSMGSTVSSPSGVWGGAPAEIEFGVFSLKIWQLQVATVLMILLRINWHVYQKCFFPKNLGSQNTLLNPQISLWGSFDP